MNENIQVSERLEKFLHNIELQLHDLEFERAGYKIKIYFDTSDMEALIKGIVNFFKAGNFRHDLFKLDKTMVHCLAAGGHLGEICMLSPHKAELFNRLKYLRNVGIEERPDKLALKFLRETKFDRFEWIKVFKDRSYIDQIISGIDVDTVESFFKTVQSLSPWHKRLQELINENRLALDKADHNNGAELSFSSILSTNHFKQLKNIFQAMRGDERSLNNLTDAMSVSMLIEKVKAFHSRKNNSIKEIPLFFASSETLKVFLDDNAVFGQRLSGRIRKHIKEVKELLTFPGFNSSQHSRISVMRDESYFIFRAIIGNESLGRTKDDRMDLLVHKLTDWRKQIQRFLRVQKGITKESWIEGIEKRERVFFFQDVWLRSKAPKDLYMAVAQTIEAYEEFKSRGKEGLKEQISRNLIETEDKIKGEVKDANMIVLLSDELENDPGKKISALRKKFNLNQDDLKQQFFNFFPFYRYSYPLRAHDEIVVRLRGLLDRQTTDLEIQNLIEQYATFVDLTNKIGFRIEDPDMIDLAAITAILQILELNKPLKHLLEKIDPKLPHYSFKIVLAELHFPQTADPASLREKVGRAESIIRELETSFEQESDLKSRSSLAIGLSLLYFFRWRRAGINTAWSSFDETVATESPAHSKVNSFLNKAIGFAEKAYRTWDRSSETTAEKIYSLNLVLYFSAKSDNDNKEKIEEYSGTLISYAAMHKDKWQFRYDDTIAFYFCKLAVIYARNQKELDQYLKDAKNYLQKAKRRAPEDEIVLETERVFEAIMANRHKIVAAWSNS